MLSIFLSPDRVREERRDSLGFDLECRSIFSSGHFLSFPVIQLETLSSKADKELRDWRTGWDRRNFVAESGVIPLLEGHGRE